MIGKKIHVMMTVLKNFEQYLATMNHSQLHCLDDSIKLRSFGFIIREAVPFPHGMDMMSKCYHLDEVSDLSPFLTLVRQLIEKKDYLKVEFELHMFHALIFVFALISCCA